MWNTPRNMIFLILLAILAIIGFLIYVWRDNYGRMAGENGQEVSAFPDSPQCQDGGCPLLEKYQRNKAAREAIEDFGLFSSEGNLFQESPLEDFKPILKVFNDIFLKPAPAAPLKAPAPSPSAPTYNFGISQNFQNIQITEQELFEFAYPPDYLNQLRYFNQVMIDWSYLPPDQVYPLNSFEDVDRLQDKFTEFLLTVELENEDGTITKFYTQEDVERYQKMYKEALPKLWEEELRAKKAAEHGLSPLERLLAAFQEVIRGKKIKSTLSALQRGFTAFIPKVEASHSMSPCYREGSPNLIRGSQRTPPEDCCNCGLVKRRRCRWAFVNDCGHNGERCDVQLGCLNAACPGLPAIWDPETGICGCHI